MHTNIGYWEQILQAPTLAYQALFDVSEQFSFQEISALAKSAGLKIIVHQKIGDLAYICSLIKQK